MFSAQTLDRDGFVILPNVLTDNDVAGILGELLRSPLAASRAGARHLLKHTAVSCLAHDPRLLVVARAALDSNAFPFRATLFDKSGESNWLVVWHQDTTLPLQERHDTLGWGPWSVKAGVIYAHAPASALSKVLALRVHLDDCMAENGPLGVLPDTHRLGVLTDQEIHLLAMSRQAVDCIVGKGGVLALRPLLVHSSSKMQTRGSWRVLHIEYGASTRAADGLDLAIA